MITLTEKTPGDLISTLEDYDVLLDSLQTVTSQLVTAIDAWDADQVETLIEKRSELCDRIGQSIEILTGLAAERDGLGLQQSPVFVKLEEAMRNALEKHSALMEQQGEAQQRLSRELQRRRPGMAKMTERRGRHQAYRKTSAVQHGRFLDSRL